MRLTMMGTRGVPARYGGFETAVEEIGRRLVDRGHEVTVFCRQPGGPEYLGMRRVELPALRFRAAETLSHSVASATRIVREAKRDPASRPDMVFLFNAANSPVLPMLHRAGIPVAVHVDGLEWRRGKWSGIGRRYYLGAEGLAVAWADALIADAVGIAEYYQQKFGVETEQIAYGAPLLGSPSRARLAELGLESDGYHLVVARTEPENNVDLIVAGYQSSACRLPLVIVGGTAYETEYQRDLATRISSDDRIRQLGPIYDQDLLDTLYAGSRTYVHGHTVGGTNPSLLRALGAGSCVLATGNTFNAEVLGGAGLLFDTVAELRTLLVAAERDPLLNARVRNACRDRAAAYSWDDVSDRYEELAKRLADGWRRGRQELRPALRTAMRVNDEAVPRQAPLPFPQPVRQLDDGDASVA
ncbi:MAG: hypothetical protein QOC98_2980 [Frankiaceae bacterium]|nr:hypothetical protein [Frankiaceae bacterium]